MDVRRISCCIAVALAAGALIAGPASAQSRGQSRPHDRGGEAVRAPQGTAIPRVRSAPEAQNAPRQFSQVRPAAPQAQRPQLSRVAPDGRRAITPNVAIPRYGARDSAPRVAPSQRVMPTSRYAPSSPYAPPVRYLPSLRYVAPSARYGGVRYYGGSRYVVTPRYIARPLYRPSAPYYAFRPRLRLGFGIFIGYPVSFPSWYDPYVPGMYSAYRAGDAYGGVSFDIRPYDADVYVDGEYVGVVNEFSPLQPPLTLVAGVHHIDIEASGLEPLSFDITIVPRQVIPYQGSLSR
jgi:hypothetical protein